MSNYLDSLIWEIQKSVSEEYNKAKQRVFVRSRRDKSKKGTSLYGITISEKFTKNETMKVEITRGDDIKISFPEWVEIYDGLIEKAVNKAISRWIIICQIKGVVM